MQQQCKQRGGEGAANGEENGRNGALEDETRDLRV